MQEMEKFVNFWGGNWGRERERERGKNPIYTTDGSDKKTTE